MIRVLLVEDMALVRTALVALIHGEGDMQVVAELDRGEDVVATAQEVEPHVAIIDAYLPGIDGLTAARRLRRAVPLCQAMIMTAFGSPQLLRKAIEADVQGFVQKKVSAGFLIDGIRRVAEGERVIDPDLAMSVLTEQRLPLTTREREVLAMAAEGASVQEMASRISLSSGTVRNYLSSVVNKLGARNRLDAVRIARDAGWI